MKITAILGAIQSNDYGLNKVYEIIKSTMNEIGEEINLISLVEANLPYYNGGAPVTVLSSIVNEINESDGVIFLTPSLLFAPSGIMQTFLEYLSMPVYKNALRGKNCMTISISHNQNISHTMNYFSTIITYLGGYNSVNIPLNTTLTKNIDDNTKILLEKYTEDFYRYVKQGRKFFTCGENSIVGQVTPAGGVFSKPSPKSELLTPPSPTATYETTPINEKPTFKSTNVANAYNSNVMDSFYQAQENDISEISNLLSSKLSSKEKISTKNTSFVNEYKDYGYVEDTPLSFNDNVFEDSNKTPITHTEQVNSIFNNFDIEKPVAKPSSLSCKQMTKNLTHYYQPHLADGLTANIALSITGHENFDGFIQIDGNNCNFFDGTPPTPDVTILSSDEVWKQIIKGTLTTQRAFMTGQLKVRGNFVLLSKFDLIFKK